MNRIKPNELDEKKKHSLVSRIVVAALLIAVAVPCIFLGGWFWFSFLTIFLLLACFEMIHATGKKYPIYVYAFAYVFVLAEAYWFIAKGNVEAYLANPDGYSFSLSNTGEGIGVSVVFLVASIIVYWAIALFDHRFDLFDAVYFLAVGLLISLGFQGLLFVRYFPLSLSEDSSSSFAYYGSVTLLLFVCIATVMNDTWAYFVGIFFGRHKMIPAVSPNKTWEGFFGGWILGGATCLAFALLTDYFGFPLLDSLAIFGAGSKWWWAVVLSFLLPLIGDVGDLTFSLIKRHFGIKDFGFIFLAHGGVLDRADSFTFTAMFTAVFVSLLNSGLGFLL